MLCDVTLHNELTELRAEVGLQVFDDPVAFRAAFDDFIPEGSATTGEVSLLVGAIGTGALQRLRDQLEMGADPEVSIAAQGELLARDRGTSESDGARWALSVLAHAVGAVPVAVVPTRPRSTSAPAEGSFAEVPVTAPVPTTDAPVTQIAGEEPAPATAATGQTTSAPTESRRRGRPALLLAAVIVLAAVASTAVALLILRDTDPSGGTASDGGSSAAEGRSEGVIDEEILAQIEMVEPRTGKTGDVLLVRNDTDVAIVLMTDQGGQYGEVDRNPVVCPYSSESSYDVWLEDQGKGAIYFGWENRDTKRFEQFAEVRIKDKMLITYQYLEPCPAFTSVL